MRLDVTLIVVCSLLLGMSTIAPVFSDDGFDVQTLSQRNTLFALDLYARIRLADGNLFFSPYSIFTALSMTYAGAREETARQMSSVLRLPLESTELHSAFKEFLDRLQSVQRDKKIELRIANSLWPQEGHPFLKEYVDLLRSCYGAEVIPVDYRRNTTPAVREVNSWIEKMTNGKILGAVPDSLDPYPQTSLILANAIYFKGQWLSRFNTDATKDMPFHLSSIKTVDVPMMQQTSDLRYGEDGLLQVLEMPYTGDDLSMVVLLPRQVDGLLRVEQALTADKLKGWTEGTYEQPVAVFLPRFSLDFQLDLKATLAAMGMTDAFEKNRGNFAGMDGSPKRVTISFARHCAFVEVYEEGTEAAAATVGGGGCFPAGTPVLTPSGPRPIEALSFGAAVYAYDMTTRQWTVTRVHSIQSLSYQGDMVTIQAGGVTLEATGNHPFLVLRGDDVASRPVPQDVPADEVDAVGPGHWVAARDLKAGDVLMDKMGGSCIVNRISSRPETTVVYNLGLDDHHNYAVHQIGILVHNKGGKEAGPVTFRADHPFMFLIRHNPTGTILFLGRLVDPSAE